MTRCDPVMCKPACFGSLQEALCIGDVGLQAPRIAGIQLLQLFHEGQLSVIIITCRLMHLLIVCHTQKETSGP